MFVVSKESNDGWISSCRSCGDHVPIDKIDVACSGLEVPIAVNRAIPAGDVTVPLVRLNAAIGVFLIFTVAVTVCVAPQVPVRMAVGSPNFVGSSTPKANPGLVWTSPHRRPRFKRFSPIRRLVPALLPPSHRPPSLIGFSVNGNLVP